MTRARGGFTVVEVLIVLAITGLLFISAVALFRGKQGQTQFNQAMYDLESKVNSVATDVKSGSFEDSSQYDCVRRPVNQPGLTQPASGGSGTGTNTDCITLGRAIQVIPSETTLYIYTVLGLRLLSSGEPVSTLEGARPSIMIGGQPLSTVDLTKEYNLAGGAVVVSAQVQGIGGAHDIAGFYLSPTGGSSAGQGSTFTALAYPFASTSGSDRSNQLENCVLQVSPCDNPPTLGIWTVCVRSSDDKWRASLDVTSVPGGIKTNLKFEECS